MADSLPPRRRPDFGSMALAVLGDGQTFAKPSLADGKILDALFAASPPTGDGTAAKPLDQKLLGAVGRTIKARAGRRGDRYVRRRLAHAEQLPRQPLGRQLLCQAIRRRGRRLPLHREQLPSTGQRHRALAQHVLRFNFATVAIGSDRRVDLQSGDRHVSVVAERSVLGLGGRRLLRRNVRPRVELRTRHGPVVPRARAIGPHDAGFRSGHRLQPRNRFDRLSRRGLDALGRRLARRLHPQGVSRTLLQHR